MYGSAVLAQYCSFESNDVTYNGVQGNAGGGALWDNSNATAGATLNVCTFVGNSVTMSNDQSAGTFLFSSVFFLSLCKDDASLFCFFKQLTFLPFWCGWQATYLAAPSALQGHLPWRPACFATTAL